MIGDIQRAKVALLSLKNQGVQVALDDFGTGYSSLFLLRELPIDKIKIDQSFVGAMLKAHQNAQIVNALIGLGRALNLKITAEGIEDMETLTALRELNCSYGQGYLFGRAAPEPIYEPIPKRAIA
jgi:EAL domain-containing protein (putative c-di-GMP-specific phosphodiesterase class I)